MKKYENVVVLTGAGISAESGIPTFRDSGGLWDNHSTEEVATPQGYKRNKRKVLEFYNKRTQQVLQTAPNKAHIALALFEKHFHGKFTLITQNVDNLHEQGGSFNVIHMHGQLAKARCEVTGQVWDCHPITEDTACPCCNKVGTARPHVVFFEEYPLDQHLIEAAIVNCDLFVSIGTSGNVYPASTYVNLAKANGADTVELNLEPSVVNSNFDFYEQGLATVVVPDFFNKLLESYHK